MAASGESSPDHAFEHEVRLQLGRILASRRFSQSPSLSRLLHYVIEEELAGRGDGLKEQIVGLEVFERGKNFDPRIDPIVRVQAAKVRSRLKEYYETEGAADSIMIDLPKGTYCPVMTRRSSLPTPPVDVVAPAAAPIPKEVPVPEEPPARPTPSRRWLAVAALAFPVLAAVGWYVSRPQTLELDDLAQFTTYAGVSTFPSISNDGRTVAYASGRESGDLNIWIQALGSEPRQLTRHSADDRTPDLSPDGTQLVFRSERDNGGLYVMSVHGGAERLIANNGYRPRFSPDGRWIVYQGDSHRPQGDLYIIPSGGGKRVRVNIGTDVELGGGPVWTPDGNHLVFLGVLQGKHDWYIVPKEGGAPVSTGLAAQLQRQGLPEPEIDTIPGDWFQRQLVFGLRHGNAINLYTARFTSQWTSRSPVSALTTGAGRFYYPRIASNGRTVFTSDKLFTHIHRLRLDETARQPQQLTHDTSLRPGFYLHPPRFSVGGNRLAFASSRSGKSSVWLRDLDTGQETAISGGQNEEDQPLLSADGRWLAYRSGNNGKQAIFLTEIGRRAPEMVCGDCGEPESFFPDRRHLLYRSDKGLFQLELGTGNSRALLASAQFRVRTASLSGDGKWLLMAVVDLRSDYLRTVVIPFTERGIGDASAWIDVTEDRSLDSAHWAAEADAVYFLSHRDEYHCIWSQRLDPTTHKPVGEPTGIKHFHRTRVSPWNPWIVVTGDHLYLTLTDPISELWTGQLKP